MKDSKIVEIKQMIKSMKEVKINYKQHIAVIVIIVFLLTVAIWIALADYAKEQNDYEYSTKHTDYNNNITLLFVGDILLGRNVENDAFEYVKQTVGSADISFANLEYAITESTSPVDKNYGREQKTINLKSSCYATRELKYVGFDVVSLANNHMMDYGEEGLNGTITCLNDLGLLYAGAGKNKEEAKKLTIIDKKGKRIGLLSYTSVSPSSAYAKNKKAGVSDIRSNIGNDIYYAKRQVDFLVVYAHWGREFNVVQNDFQTEKAMEMIDAGADIVIGSHPHVVQPFEIYKGKYIFYSLGNFVFDQEHDVTKDSMAVKVTLNGSQTVEIKKINLQLKDTKPYILDAETLQLQQKAN